MWVSSGSFLIYVIYLLKDHTVQGTSSFPELRLWEDQYNSYLTRKWINFPEIYCLHLFCTTSRHPTNVFLSTVFALLCWRGWSLESTPSQPISNKENLQLLFLVYLIGIVSYYLSTFCIRKLQFYINCYFWWILLE